MLKLAYNDASNSIGHQISPAAPSLGYSLEFFRSVVHDFWTTTCGHPSNFTGQDIQAPMSIITQAVLPRAFQNKILGSAIFAICTMYLGRLRRDAKLRELAIAAYPSALSRFRSDLILNPCSQSNQTSKRIHSLVIAVSLLFFEWLANGPNEKGFQYHLNGALDMIKLSGAQSLQSPITRVTYTDLRGTVFLEALTSRKATFLATDHWITIPYQLTTKTSRELSLDLLLCIPGLLERADQIKLRASRESENTKVQACVDGCYFSRSQCLQAIEYFQDCDSLIRKLYNWLASVEELEKGPLWWYAGAPTLTGKSQSDETCQSMGDGVYPSPRIHFSSPKVPGLIISYWTGLLELFSTILTLREIFDHDAFYALSCSALGVDSPSMFIDADSPSILAMHICQTVLHLGSSLEGCTMAYIPALLAENYFSRAISDCQSNSGDASDTLRDYNKMRVGLECSKKGLEMVQDTLQNYQ
ncbi:hypothetical protein F5884DRAFT_860865 [Xylogone sp. PMI_703]|nr:hypothetical protein F5884DRAFT_860865 [Xylogone sp. PMI_703]